MSDSGQANPRNMDASRQRVRASLAHREPDRVVVDLGATTSSGISGIAYDRLKTHLAVHSGHTRIFDVIQQLARVEDELLETFGVDVASIGRQLDQQSGEWYPVTLAQGAEVQWPAHFRPVLRADGSRDALDSRGKAIGRMPASGPFFDQVHFPYVDGYPHDFEDLADAMSQVLWGRFPRMPWQSAGESDFWERLRAGGTELREKTGRALVVSVGCNMLEWGMFLRRMDQFLMDLHTEPRNVERFLEALAEHHLALLARAVEAVGDIADVFRFGDDLGMVQGPLISPEIYRRFFKPRHKQLCDYVKRRTDAFTLLHSCGSIYELIPDLIEAGFDCINPVQTSCRDMEPARLKREFGRELVFWGGGCDTRTVLNNARANGVKDHVRRNLDILAPGGGFVFCTVHNILPEVPPENIVAMFEAVGEFTG
ncbi:MAG: uroporphyrinogen decarboxylase family protein [Planctomycetota bacterium]